MYSKKPYTKAVDIWSLGVILYVMTTGSFPFEGDTLQILSRKILTKNPSFPAQVSNEMKQLIIGLLQKDPDQRLTIEEILETPIVKNFLSQNPFKTTKATKSMSEEERAALVHSLNDEETLIPLTGFNPFETSSQFNAKLRFENIHGMQWIANEIAIRKIRVSPVTAFYF